MFTVEQLLSIAKEKKASDVHVTVGLHLIHQTVLKIAVLRVQQQSRRGVRWIS